MPGLCYRGIKWGRLPACQDGAIYEVKQAGSLPHLNDLLPLADKMPIMERIQC